MILFLLFLVFIYCYSIAVDVYEMLDLIESIDISLFELKRLTFEKKFVKNKLLRMEISIENNLNDLKARILVLKSKSNLEKRIYDYFLDCYKTKILSIIFLTLFYNIAQMRISQIKKDLQSYVDLNQKKCKN